MKKVILLAVTLVILMCTQVFGDQTSMPFSVSSSVTGTCMFSTAIPELNFGAYESGQFADLNGTTNIEILCTIGEDYALELDYGNAEPSGPRYLLGATTLEHLDYDLYQDVSRTILWAKGTDAQAGTGTGVSEFYTVYGKIPGSQTVAVDTYSDIISATIIW